MFNHVLAMLLGLTAIILGVVATINFDLLQARQYDLATTKEQRDEDIRTFLDSMDRSREERYTHAKQGHERSRNLDLYDGYRSDWYSYENEWLCNFSMS